MRSIDRFHCLLATVGSLCSVLACSPGDRPRTERTPEAQAEIVRLVDQFSEAQVGGSVESPTVETGAIWSFADETTFAASPSTEDVSIREGRLAGRATTDFPLVRLERTEEIVSRDLLHAIEVRARVSAGRNLELTFGREPMPWQAVEGRGRALPSDHRAPLMPGETMQTYRIKPGVPVAAPETRHLFLRPSDEAGATFEIESVRLIFRQEHLASIPAGIGWHGMAEIYRETVVSRSPERITYRLDLPPRPRLDLALGTVEGMPVTFVAEVSAGETREQLFERTVTRPDRWEEVTLDLADFGGQSVELTLSLRAEDPGSLGFWGSPRIVDLDHAGADRPPSVLLIIADTLRFDHLDLYGYQRPTAPALRHFASGGTTFDQCVAQATWTKVSVPSILTGLYPLTHGVLEFQDRLAAGATTLAETYRDAGYTTLSMTSIRFAGAFTNLHQGFEVLHESRSIPDDAGSKTARHYVDRLLPWLGANRDVPFFALLHVADPHAPYRPEAPYDSLWADPDRAQTFEQEVAAVVPEIENPLLRRFEMPTREELARADVDPGPYVAHEHDWYDGSIRAMDAELGRLFERIRELGLEDEIVVAFVADHGTEFLDHGRHWHGHSVYGELARVPLVLRGPGIAAGRVRGDTVQTIDLAPTLLTLSGLEVPSALQGQTLTPLLTDPVGERRAYPAFTFKAALTGTAGPPPLATESSSMVADDFKLIAHATPEGATYELYRPHADPLNHQNVASQHPEVVTKMATDIDAWRRATEAERIAGDETLEQLDAEELERLRSLGYIN